MINRKIIDKNKNEMVLYKHISYGEICEYCISIVESYNKIVGYAVYKSRKITIKEKYSMSNYTIYN